MKVKEPTPTALIIIAWCFFLTGGIPGIGILASLAALGCSIGLIVTNNTAARIHGTIILILWVITFMIGFMIGFTQAIQ